MSTINRLLETFPVGTAEERKKVKKLIQDLEEFFEYKLNKYEDALNHRDDPFSDEHIQSVYDVVKEWYEQYESTKLLDFEIFKKSIDDNKETIKKIKEYNRLETIDSFSTIEKEIRTLFGKLNLAVAKSKLVVFSMTMHLFLPDLLMPINRTHTLKFFKKPIPPYDKNETKEEHEEKEIKIYKYIFEQSREYSHKLTPPEDYLQLDGWSRNIPKLIDGLIISHMTPDDEKEKKKKKMKKRRERENKK
jgi:hypothetical protein